jgi:hypothetical protein
VQGASEWIGLPDQLQPEQAEGHKVGDRYVATRNGESIEWRRLYRPLELRSEDEVLVFLVAHEAFHYLRKTRQVEGRHGEIEADAFALKKLERYRDESNIVIPTDTQLSMEWSQD